jgi:hypothetical protein
MRGETDAARVAPGYHTAAALRVPPLVVLSVHKKA